MLRKPRSIPPRRATASLSALILAWGTLAGRAGGQSVVYVDADEPPGGDGSSWKDAYNDLTDALDAVAGPFGIGAVVDQMWVKEGTYFPRVPSPPANPRDGTFFLLDDLEMLGGFAGDEETPDQRDPGAHPTILDGDIGIPGDPTDNCWHIVRAHTSVTEATVVDGFTIRNGYAVGDNERGAGAKIDSAEPVFINCRFEDNYAAQEGGAVESGGRVTFIGCTFVNNQSELDAGGAIFCATRTVLIGCDFVDNAAAIHGGAVYARDLTMIDCAFTGNTGGSGGTRSPRSPRSPRFKPPVDRGEIDAPVATKTQRSRVQSAT